MSNNCEINVQAIENHYIDLLREIRFTNNYATFYRESCMRWKSIINAVFGVLPLILITIISFKKEWLDVLLILAAASTAFEAIVKYLPYGRRAEELLKVKITTDVMIVKLEYIWVQYKHKTHDIDWLIDQQKNINTDYIQAINENLVQVTYPIRKKAHKLALDKTTMELQYFLGNEKEE